jgi:hypothetical protein
VGAHPLLYPRWREAGTRGSGPGPPTTRTPVKRNMDPLSPPPPPPPPMAGGLSRHRELRRAGRPTPTLTRDADVMLTLLLTLLAPTLLPPTLLLTPPEAYDRAVSAPELPVENREYALALLVVPDLYHWAMGPPWWGGASWAPTSGSQSSSSPSTNTEARAK